MSSADGVAAARPDGMFKRAVLNLRAQRDFARNHWLASVFYSAAIVVGGWVLGDLYNAWKPWHDNTDAQLQQLREEQAAAFKDLDGKLGTLTRSVDADGREALRDVEGLVRDIRDTNTRLLQQLVLAREENTRLSQVGGAQAGISGGYDFILTPITGIRVDSASVVGVGNISRDGAHVRVTAAGGTTGNFLRNGQAIAYVNAAGESCRVALLSVTERSAASFDVACDPS